VRALRGPSSGGYDIVPDGAASGNEANADHWSHAQQRYVRCSAWLEDNADQLLRAVLRR
jgi:hypothetical protein